MPPQTIDHYIIRAELGRGGMSIVYRAFDPRFEREVAIKVLPTLLAAADESFRTRFEREARIIAALEHSAIVSVYDYGEANGQLYFVMRLMSGSSLADRIRQGPLSLPEAARILNRLAPALDAAHNQGVVHRDVKPGNILFDQYGDVYLSDFGIVKLTQAAATLTGSNVIIGTPAYMSPEQGRGDPDIDGRSDIYALGAVLFEMLTGRVPYEAETPTGQIIKHITEPVPNILEVRKDLPLDCQIVIEHSMAKNKGERFATARDMAQALSSIDRGEALSVDWPVSAGSVAHPSSGVQAPVLTRTRPRILVGLSFVGGLILLAVLAYLARPLFVSQLPASAITQSLTVSASPTLTLTSGVMPRQPSATLTALRSPTRTATRRPVLTKTLTSTATPLPRAFVGKSPLNVRTGPGMAYPIITNLPEGAELEVLGRNAEGTWLAVRLPNRAEPGWVSAAMVNLIGDLEILPILSAGPTPTLRLRSPAAPTEAEVIPPTNTPPPTATETLPPPTDTPPPPTDTSNPYPPP